MRSHERRGRATTRRRGLAAAAGILVSISAAAQAQDGPPPPPGYGAQPPPGYGAQPPPGYGPGAPMTGPKVMNWNEDEPVPPGYHLETRVRKGLVISGAIVFGTVYVFTAIGGGDAVSKGYSGYAALFVPVAGPFITLGTTDQDDLATMGLVLDGLVQATGMALLVPGLVVPRTVLVRNDVSEPFVMPMPMSFGAGSAGLGLVGRF